MFALASCCHMHVGCKQCQTKNAVVLIVTAVYCLTLEMTRLVMTYEVCQAFKVTFAGYISKYTFNMSTVAAV